jgi:hypothetical protein
MAVLGFVAAAVVLAGAVLRMLRRGGRGSPPPDVHWGDWPPDQMAP